MVEKASLEKSLAEYQIPGSLHGGIIRWVCDGIPPGSFLKRIIENDAEGATLRADQVNVHHVAKLLLWFTREAPAECWGSNTNILDWIYQHKRKIENGQTGT